MMYYSRNSSIVHFDGCRYLDRIKGDNLCSVDTWEHAIEMGLSVCRCCSPVLHSYKNELTHLSSFCTRNGIVCFEDKGAVFLQTVKSKWMVVPSCEHGMSVYHKNTRFRKTNIESPIVGYHLQNVKCRSITEACEYIIGHDAYWTRQSEEKNKNSSEGKEHPKGSRRWRAQQKKIREKNRIQAIKNVFFLFDQIESMPVHCM